jgi:hypothetical protein
MIRYIFTVIIIIHGVIHLMVFSKELDDSSPIKGISKPMKAIWLSAALSFVIAAVLFLLKIDSWSIIAMASAVLSQLLILSVWKAAKFGTILNVIIFFIAAASFSIQYFEFQFEEEVRDQLHHSAVNNKDLLTEEDLRLLPQSVQKYLRLSGVVNKPKVKNMRVEFVGKMRAKGGNWFPFESVQYNFFDNPARLFFMKATMYGTTVPGFHDYQSATARMDIKLFGLFTIIEESGIVMNISETVTVFNDMCLFAPATLIDKRIQWEEIDKDAVKAIFTNEGFQISATLKFNKKGQLVNFISDNRYDINDMKQYRFSTPVKAHKKIHNLWIPTYGEAIWHYPEGEFVYGQFQLKDIDYNVNHFQK